MWKDYLIESSIGSLENVLLMGAILIPMMILLEFAKETNILNILSERAGKIMGFLGMSGQAAFPLVVGGIFGLAYGAGVIIESARSGLLTWRDLFLVNIFLSVFHSIFEDTALFLALGADFKIILICRFLLAVVITLALSRLPWVQKNYPEKLVKAAGINK